MFDNAVHFHPGFIFKGHLDVPLNSKGSVYSLPMGEQRVFNFILSKPIQTSKGFFRVIFGADLTDDGSKVVDEKISCRIVLIKLNNPKGFERDVFDKWYDGIAEEKIHEIFMTHLYVEA